MARFKPLFVAAGVLLLIAVGLGAYDVVGESIIEARAEVTRTNLSSIGRKIAEFRATQGRFPRGAEELALQPDMLVDTLSGRNFVWAQAPPDGTRRVPVVWQPAPYRTGPWPFGEMAQITLFSDNVIGDRQPENAAR
ncbi:MAG: hypothetical protein ABSA67_01800 [Candidatus Brocadiia bacterium]